MGMALVSNEVIRKGELLTLGLWLLSWLCRDKQEGCLTPTLPPALGKSWGLGLGLLAVGNTPTGRVYAKEL